MGSEPRTLRTRASFQRAKGHQAGHPGTVTRSRGKSSTAAPDPLAARPHPPSPEPATRAPRGRVQRPSKRRKAAGKALSAPWTGWEGTQAAGGAGASALKDAPRGAPPRGSSPVPGPRQGQALPWFWGSGCWGLSQGSSATEPPPSYTATCFGGRLVLQSGDLQPSGQAGQGWGPCVRSASCAEATSFQGKAASPERGTRPGLCPRVRGGTLGNTGLAPSLCRVPRLSLPAQGTVRRARAPCAKAARKPRMQGTESAAGVG